MNPQTLLLVLRLIDLAATGLALVPEIRARYDQSSARLRAIIEEGREPTPAEFDELLAESDDLTRQLRDAVAAKEGRLSGPELSRHLHR